MVSQRTEWIIAAEEQRPRREEGRDAERIQNIFEENILVRVKHAAINKAATCDSKANGS